MTRTLEVCIVEVKKLLLIWINDLTQKRIPLSLKNIQEKALSLYDIMISEEKKQLAKDLTSDPLCLKVLYCSLV